MDKKSHVSKNLRKSILLKVISKSIPTKEDLDSIIELTANKVIDYLNAQSITIYLIEGEQVVFKYIYYSHSLWENNPHLEKKFEDKKNSLINFKIPLNTGLVGKVIQTGKSNIFTSEKQSSEELYNMSKTTEFNVTSMLTVPLQDQRVIGAIQVLNKEPKTDSSYFDEKDLLYLEEVAEYTSSLLLRILDPNYSLNEVDMAKYIARFTDSFLITDENDVPLDKEVLNVIDGESIRKFGVFPYKWIEQNQSVAVLMKNPMDFQNRELFSLKTQLLIDDVAVVPNSLFESLCTRYFQGEVGTSHDIMFSSQKINELTAQLGKTIDENLDHSEIEKLKNAEENSAPIVKLINKIIEDAYFSNASDIHIEPQETRLVVRYRIDGICIEKLSLPPQAMGSLVARVKIMCDLDIAQKRLPQDGRIDFSKYTSQNVNIDLRVATCPTLFGEKITMRILDKKKSALPITSLGFSEENLGIYRRCITLPYGMILHCGPTGSGKSMTLFSALREIANPDINIQTAEDPIEYTINGINQMQVHKSIGLTFANALRSFLRMDPDVILVGEIRDQETAEIAIEAALTGHLLLSTLHTNDAPSTVARLLDMGIDPFMISSSLIVVCAQRLIRRVCSKCCVEHDPISSEVEILQKALNWSGKIVNSSEKGCPFCGSTGMRGRIGIHELMENNQRITEAINAKADTSTLKKIAMESGMKSLHQDSMLKVKDRLTTILEAVSAATPDK